ncbi:DUF4494 domain-containing protein [Arsenicibacter rosenii]|uniref:DUF4494 domain-containing protein n=1 Tax=Arsenicibacter rosenii TaxID=1750698 RepID=A0A1S2VA84_9BACT|nr:DUF4494 domain-containing protein [Arsenicibacter rosenii]OIN55641.1 hypothetical protein BLX24_29090 [Arsenicibacter rosenii]
MPIWFQGKIKYQKEVIVNSRQGDQVKVKTFSEVYLIDAVSFIDAETRLTEQIAANIPDFTVSVIGKMKLADVFCVDGGQNWYKCKVIFTTEDNKGREKKLINSMLINADSVRSAYDRLQEAIKTILLPAEITEVSKTPILEIFPYTEPAES